MPGLIAIPCLEMISTVAAESLHRMLLHAPQGSRELFDYNPFPVHLKRDRIAHEMLKVSNLGLDWVLMVDSDMLPPEDAISQLQAALADFDIVGALCFARRPPHPVCAGTWNVAGEPCNLKPEPSMAPLLDVEWVGTGCVMIKRAVFERLNCPWFEPQENGRGEDLTFMRKAKAGGFRIGCAQHVRVGHLNLINIDELYARWWSEGVSLAASDLRAENSWSTVKPLT